jgi:hypothetical protein
MSTRITKYLNKYVRRSLCLIYISSLTGNGRKLSHNGSTAGNFDIPDHGFLLLTCSTGPMEWSTVNSYQAEALTNVKPWSGMSKLSAVQPLWLNYGPLPVSRIAWTLVLHYLLQSRGVKTVLLYIFIKQRHVQTTRNIRHGPGIPF